MNIRQTTVLVTAAVLLCLVLCFPSITAAAGADEAGFKLTEQSLANLREEGLAQETLEKLEALKDQKFNTEDAFLEAVRKAIGNDQTLLYKQQILKYAADNIAEIKQITEVLKAQKAAIEALQEQNRALMERLAELETAEEERAQKEIERKQTEAEREQRLKELEATETARDDASRSIIRDALSTVGSKINESVALGGTFEVLAGANENFIGQSDRVIQLNTVQLDFEVQVNDWSLGSVTIQYEDGTGVIFPTNTGGEASVDRINLDTAFLTIGDMQRFWPFLTAGRIVAPFGISTGDPVADVLSIEDPLTIQVFETKEDAVLFGVGFPTPPLTPAAPPVTPPRVKPLVINPLVGSLSRFLGYKPPPTPPPPPVPITPAPELPPFNAGIYIYNGDTQQGFHNDWRPSENFGATAGFRAKGNCGRPFEELVGSAFCPWKFDIDVDYNSSVFDSLFLESEYSPFLNQINNRPGVAAHIKSTFGPIALVGEWNGAITPVRFIDSLGREISMKPSAWGVSLGYQFDWNPWVQAIGAQGNYITVGYSESDDLGGVTQLVGGVPTRVGFVPKRRLIVGAGEWILDNLQWAIEYSYNHDYSKSEGGTDNNAHGFFTQITALW